MKSLIILIISAVLILGGISYLSVSKAKPSPDEKASAAGIYLAAEESFLDFGTLSMAQGPVSKMFKVKNNSSKALAITRVYTSCMCTIAILEVEGEKWGPFGMPGHGILPRIKVTLNPGEEARIETVFDPAAHGPAGVGKVERAIYLENDAGGPLELRFTATVTP